MTIKAGKEQNIYTTSLKVNGESRGRAWIDLEEIEKLRQMGADSALNGDMFSQQLGSLSGLAQKIPPFLRK